MDLRGNQITVGEIVSSPQAKELLKREFPEIMNPLMLQMAKNMTLANVLELGKGRYPQTKIDSVLAQLQAI